MNTSGKVKGNEMFSFDKDGNKVDDHIHYPILDNPRADDALNKEYLVRLMQQGYPKDMIMRIATEIARQQLSRAKK